MRAIVVEEGPDHRLRWLEVEDPRPGPEDLLVRVSATAVNRADLLQRIGRYPPPPGAPEWMGLEASGTVQEVGPDSGSWRPGDRVTCLLPGGGYAERVAVHHRLAVPVPDGMTLVDAASLPEVFAPLLADGRIRPVVHAVFDIEEAEAAHEVLQRRENVGKVVLQVAD